MGIEFVGFRVWATHRKLRKKTAKKLKRRLQYMFHAYTIGEIDKDTLDRSVASYRGILKHFDSYGLRKSLNEMYKKEVCGNVTGAIADSEGDSGVACGGGDNN
jgi:predicted metal-dependent phosphoesterase TrpH